MRPSRSQPPPSPVRDLHRAVRRLREPPKEAGRMPRRALRSIFIVMAPSQTESGNGVERHDSRFLERAVFVDDVARGFTTAGHQTTVNAEYLAADRSEDRRDGKEWVRQMSYGGWR